MSEMFDLDKFFAECGEIEKEEIEVGGSRFLIRRIDGVEALELSGMESQAERVIYILGRCLLDPVIGAAIGDEKAVKMLRAAEVLALELVGRIYQFSSRVAEEYEKRMGLAKKNSPEMSSGD